MSETLNPVNFSTGVQIIPSERFFTGVPDVQAPIVIVEFGGFTQKATRHHNEAYERVGLVGRHLATTKNGLFTPEDGNYNIGQGIPEHVDGVVQPYWQLNASCLGEKKKRDSVSDRVSAEITLRKRILPTGMQIANIFPPEPSHGLAKEYKNSILVKSKNQEQDRTTVEGKLFPMKLTTAEEIVCRVPLGDVVMFMNGTGQGNSFWSHETKTMLRQIEGAQNYTPFFTRCIAIGRVVLR